MSKHLNPKKALSKHPKKEGRSGLCHWAHKTKTQLKHNKVKRKPKKIKYTAKKGRQVWHGTKHSNTAQVKHNKIKTQQN